MDDATERRARQSVSHTARRKVVEEPFDPSPRPAAAAAPSSHLVGSIVEKGFSAAAPSSAPSPTVLPFPVARHRSHGPHWNPPTRDASMADGEDDEEAMDANEMDYQPVAIAAGPVKRKEKKGMDFSRWREFIADDAPPKRRQAKQLQPKKHTVQKIDSEIVASTVGGAAREKVPGGTGMQLEFGNGKEELGGDAVMSDVASRKAMKQVDAKDDVRNVGRSRDVELRGEGVELDSREPSLAAEINAENMSRLAGMSAGEIAEAQAEILNRMNPSLVEMLKRRGREKSGSRNDGAKAKGGEISGPGKISKAMPEEWLSAGEHSGHSWKVWSERVERIRSCRFTLEGDILGFQSSQEQLDGKKSHAESIGERDFLRTEGDPAAVGYTINEAVTLTRSMVPGQRVLALQLLATILNRALQNLHKMDRIDNIKESNCNNMFNDWQAVWAYAIGPEPELVLSLRMSLDDNHDSVVLTCAKVINVMLSYDLNETYFNFLEKVVDQGNDICTAPVFRSKPDQNGGFLEGGFWKYNTKPSNILPHYGENDEEEGDEKHTIQDDVIVSGQDVAAGLVRMGILPRICFLLEMDPHPILEDYLVSILVALARHSPQSADAILNCPRLVQNVVKLLIKQGSMEIYSSQIKGVNLLKVLSKYDRQVCFNFVNNGAFQQAMWHWYGKAYTLEDWIRSGKEHCRLSSAMIVEQLRFWRTCISYGFCTTHFTDFFPMLCLWLSPPFFQKLSESNVLAEFSSIATECYLVLGALAQRLPLLHSAEQLGKQDMGVSDTHVETWSWSHAVPMVDLALSWLRLNDLPYVCSLISGQSKNILEGSYLALVISSVLGMLDSILERISPEGTPDDKSHSLPWIPDFVPKIGLGVITNGFFSFLDNDAVEPEKHRSFRGAPLVHGLCHMRSLGNVDASLCSVSCLQRLLQLSCSIDRVIQKTTTNCTEHLKESKTGIAGRILGQGICSFWCNNLSGMLTSLLPTISSKWSKLQNVEMFGRGGPAPGVGFGWGACCGGFWSLNFLLAQLDSHFLLGLMKILSAGPEGLVSANKSVNLDNVADPVAITSERISSVLGLSLVAGPGQIPSLEKAFDILFHPSILKFLKSSVHSIDSHMKLAKTFDWDITDDEYLHFSSVLNTHFRSRWLVMKKNKHSDKYTRNNSGANGPKKLETLETIQEETELAEAVNPSCSMLAVEWAHQRLPLPVHWILSPVCCIDDPKGNLSTSTSYAADVSKAGLIFLLGLEAISAAPCLHAPLVWKMHALSASIHSSMDLLQEDRSRDIFHALQELYGQHLDRLCQKYVSAHSVKKEGSVTTVEEEKVVTTGVLRFQEKIHASYTTFVENLIEQFAAVSYGDILFGRQVAIYLHRSVEPTIRLAAWNALSNAYVLELLPPLDKCVGDIQGYLEPLEDDEGILESYAKSWTTGVLDKAFQRDAMSFTVARHHLSGFVFQSSGSDKVRNKLVKSLIRCYAQKRHHEDMLTSLVLEGVAQNSQRNDEVSRRFEILKDACEMNSSLLAEVQRLKTSIDR
ncbi:transcriptional elongation regulator MINIYO [Oryza brachyantha]|uniref:Transcriptional elongation regulator MINIYO n=1 Tax=Oryza brachyantha TaxID=4533 RepID=J3MF82_ORYBR|nr:transcriptional elongation regulator MINIYO [Oryza brachyantha]XP_015694223.2 transcriptional elongation regulator MINIYO [Oryza brachyantha]XP_015694224.2 transcriptional elongation regulator MINIYO [Oryza brachyantha]XP_015694225.2 transcriptional elongation regulator MINIYO [Oryza brachyantha]